VAGCTRIPILACPEALVKRRFAPILPVALALIIFPDRDLLAEEPPPVELGVGKPAPDFTLRDEKGKDVKLSGFRGKKNVLLAFYAKDFTPGCASQWKDLRAERETFQSAEVQVLGISVDTVASHGKFRTELEIPYPLLSDAGGRVSKLYGVLARSASGDPVSRRAVFLLDREGKVIHADPRYDLELPDDRDALRKAVTALAGRKPAGKESAVRKAPLPRLEGLVFGSITVDGKEWTDDVVIDRGRARPRDKGPSKSRRAEFNHTPLTPEEDIPWDCRVLLIGIGMDGRLPVTDELKKEAEKRGVKLILKKTPEALEYLKERQDGAMNAVLHITC
jgi:peroxiredoxin